MERIIQNEYFQFLLIVIGSIIFARILHLVMRKYFRRIAKRTKTDIDDIMLRIIKKPLCVYIVIIGFYFGLKSLSALTPYSLWINRIFFVISALLLSLIIARILSVLVSRWLKVQKEFERTPRLISTVVSIAIYLIAFLMILRYLNIEITPLVATLGLGGLAVGLALQNTLANFFAGVHIISDRPINVGDYIEMDGNIAGYVEDIGWRSTRIRTLPNTIVIVPNSKIAESVIVNNYLPVQEMSIVLQCGVDYGSDLEKVEKVTVDVARKIQQTVPGAVKTFEPFIRYHTFGDSNINFSIILRVEEFVARYLVTHEFFKALKARYDKENIEISWPIRKVYTAKQ
ncbi:mechanosensitive ion channel [bacterium]|nr:mechanosensitive ion channel [bacterium]NIN91865.1 mechanosensitive ion channel [bacterium]NIO18139.1 mechanosensitive ion channel [bacterium]NIO73111.1 mechanosensitive ion channel [bacterium]